MIQPLIIPFLAAVTFLLAAMIKSTGKDTLVLMLVLAIYTIHAMQTMFMQFENAAADFELLVDSSYMMLYLPLLFAFQQLHFFVVCNIRRIAMLIALGFAGFTVLQYVIETTPVWAFDVAKTIWMTEFIILILLVQRFWFITVSNDAASNRLQKITQIYRTFSLLLLLPFFLALFSYVIPDNSALNFSRIISFKTTTIVLESVLLFLINGKLQHFRKAIDGSGKPKQYKDKIQDLTIAKN